MIVEQVKSMFAALSLDGAHPRDPAIAKILGLGNRTTAGVQVDHDKVLAIPAIKRAVQIITDKVFGIPFYLYQNTPDGREYDKDHPSWTAITSNANSMLNDAALRQQLVQWAMLWGNGCALIQRPPEWPNGGRVELLPLLPDRTEMVMVSQSFVDRENLSGRYFYKTRIADEEFSFEPADVLHIRGMGPNPHWGYNIVELLAESFGGAIAKEQHGNRFFGQGASPAGFVQMDGQLDEEEEETFIASLRRAMGGLGNHHKVILLENGAKFQQVTVDPLKSQLVEGRELDVRMLAMAMGIKVHKLIDGANSAFASLESANQEHKDDDVIPWLNKVRKEYSDKLLTADQRRTGTHEVDCDDESLEWVPFQQRYDAVSKAFNDGIIDRNEARRKLNYAPSRDKNATRLRKPENIGFEDEPRAVEVVDESPSESDEQAEALKQERLTTVRRRLAKMASAKAAKGGKEFLAWLDELKPESTVEFLQPQVDAIYQAFADQANAIVESSPESELKEKIDGIEL